MRILALAKPIPTLLAGLIAATPVLADGPREGRGPILGAGSNLSQGAIPGLLDRAAELGVKVLRDGTRWERAETEPGRFDFSGPRVGYPRQLAAAGIDVSVILNWGNPLYDDGASPHSPAGIEAFGRYAAALAKAMPEVSSLEIGNEINGTNFVKGPLKEMTPDERARAYARLLVAGADAARAARPDIRISGGATHSMAAGFLWQVLDAGAAGHLDALAIHPYTTPAEQLVRQVGVLRRHPAAAELPLEMTEFGSESPKKAGAHFVRTYCQMALSGVTRAIWFPFNDRGDGMVPLVAKDGRATTAGRAYRLIAARMEGRPAVDAATDPFTYGCRFGEDVMVLWGEPRPVAVADGIEVFDAEGEPVSAPFRLSADAPLVFVSTGGALGDGVRPGPVDLVADSFHQFAYPADGEAEAPDDGFLRFARRDGAVIPLVTLPGQERQGVPWYPYRGNPQAGPIRLTAETLLPGGGRRPVEIVHRYVAPEAAVLDVSARFKPAERSADGIAVTVLKDGRPIFEATDRAAIVFEDKVELTAGQAIDFVVGPVGSAEGDLTDYRIRLRRAGG